MKSYTLDNLARMIDHTNLHTDASPNDMKILCNEAKENHFAMVAINQVQSGLCAKLLNGTDIHIGVLFLSLWDRQQLLPKSLIQKMPLQMGQMRSITL